jgi:thiol-disulfide isomerase/thioredoxin
MNTLLKSSIAAAMAGALLAGGIATAQAPSQASPAAAAHAFPEQPRDVRLLKEEEAMRMTRAHGAELLVVNFWATTCGPCLKEMPYFEKVWRDTKSQGVVFVGLSTDTFVFDDWQPRVVQALERLDVTYPNYGVEVNPQTFIPFFAEEWGGEQPATFFYDKAGRQVHKVLGEISEKDLRATVAALREGKPAPAATGEDAPS